MPMLLNPKTFPNYTLVDIQKLSKQAIKSAAGKNLQHFVAAQGVRFGDKKASLFIITDEPANFEKLLKTKDKDVKPIVGECKILKGAKGSQIAIKSVKTGKREQVEQMIAKAFPNDTTLETVNFAALIAADSHKQAGLTLTPDMIAQMTKLNFETREFHEFEKAFTSLAKKYNMTNVDKMIVNIWSDLMKGLSSSGYIQKHIPKDTDGRSFILGYKGDSGKVIREPMLKAAMSGLSKFTAHAEKYLDKVVAEVKKAGGSPTWAFWSGTGAQATAKRENKSGVVLEGSVGSWFDEVWDFKPFTNVENLPLWAAMSEMYAKKAAEYYDAFSFRGYVGPGATREQSVFKQIEQPTLIQVLGAKVTVDPPKVDWFVVDCKKDNDGSWLDAEKPPIKAGSRDEAVAEVKRRYGS